MTKNTKGIDKARKTMAKIKKEVGTKKVSETRELVQSTGPEAMKSALKTFEKNKDVLEFMGKRAKENRGIDADDIGGSSPMLSLITDSSKPELSEGEEKKVGWFYYKPTQEMIKAPIVNIVYIKQCLLTTEFKKKITKDKKHYLLTGFIDGSNKPFVMYIKGMSYGEIAIEKDGLFGQTRFWRKNKTSPILMSAFKILLSSFDKPNQDGDMFKAISFEMMTHDNGVPMIETDVKRMQMLDQSIEASEIAVCGIIERNIEQYGTSRMENDVTDQVIEAEDAESEETAPPEKGNDSQEVDSEDVADEIPF